MKDKTLNKPKGFTKGKASKQGGAKYGFSHWITVTAIKLSVIFIAIIGIYGIYLDGKVTQTFEGQRWQVPAQVFGRVLTFDRDQQVDFAEIEKELLMLNYQRSTNAETPGRFTQKQNRFIIYRRPFDFGYGLEPASKIIIEQRDGEVYRLTQDGEQVHEVKLEPILIDRILSAEGQDRVMLPLDQIPQQLIDALLLIEDKDFYHHHGLSPTGILRAFWKNLLAGETVQGGSTLTQQLAKNMYLYRDKTIWRKVNEALISVILEVRYSKDQILEAYLNEVYLGQHYANGIHGVGLASEFYFGKPINELNNSELALIVAQIKGPSFYDPWRQPERASERRDLILRIMFENHLLQEKAYQAAITSELNIRKNRRFKKQSYPAYMQLVRRELKDIGAAGALQSGIRVFTGFDIHRQKDAENAVIEQLKKLENGTDVANLEAAMVISDIRSGQIQAVVGGKEVKYLGFNRALDAKRPIGSLIKPVVYIAALERSNKYSLATPLADKPISLTSSKGKKWQPKNYDGKFRGQVPLIDGLVQSLNVPTVNLGLEVGLENIKQTLNVLGHKGDVRKVPSILLGSINMSAFEVNQFYSTIANGGLYNEAHAVVKILSGDGERLWAKEKLLDARLSQQGAYLIDYALTQVTSTGTAKSLSWKFPQQRLAGKTGTSNDLRDSWFVGFDQKSVVTSWIGRDDNKPMGLTGSSGALTLFSNYLAAQGSNSRFDLIPDGIEFATFELATGNVVLDDCANVEQYPAITSGIFISEQCLEKRKDPPNWLEKLFGAEGE
ncbi:penicillin-binding protein 1B [Thalassotalea crassostreae]|uniref:penicillin-binding protein 1B n=1 Tax=Thalassotalea crassostreae TaxID=1763536 RepID=UPI0008393886|nr:penicillin-binding protein 1B [Thalassotalea crassostreae]